MGSSYEIVDSIPSHLASAGWQVSDTGIAITKSFRFSDFVTAISFMNTIAFKAEALDHHPEWFNVYNRVDVTLTTHHTDSLTDRDIALAEAMETVAARLTQA